MKFTIEKGLSIYDLNDAIKFFMAQHDFGELRKVTIDKLGDFTYPRLKRLYDIIIDCMI